MAKAKKKINASLRADEVSLMLDRLEWKIRGVANEKDMKWHKLSPSDVRTMFQMLEKAVGGIDYQTIPYPEIRVEFIQERIQNFLLLCGFRVEEQGIGYVLVI